MHLDLNTLRSIVTLLAFIAFVGLMLRVWRPSARRHFDEAAALPFQDESPGAGR